MSYDLAAIPLLGIYTKDFIFYHQGTSTIKFISTPFMTARKWNQPQCPSIDEWIINTHYIQIVNFFSDKDK